MSRLGLTPFFPRWFDDVDRTHSLFDQFFGQHLLDDDLTPGPVLPYYGPTPYGVHPGAHHHRGGRHHHVGYHPEQGQLAPLRPGFDRLRSGLSKVTNDRNQFKVSLDVHQFKPEEVVVKTIDNYVIIEGRHEEKEDEHGYVQRHFVRKYMLPEGVKPENVTSTLSSDGVLSIAAPKPQPQIEAGGERVVPISYSPLPAMTQGGGTKPAGAAAAVVSNGHPEQGKQAAAGGEKMEA